MYIYTHYACMYMFVYVFVRVLFFKFFVRSCTFVLLFGGV